MKTYLTSLLIFTFISFSSFSQENIQNKMTSTVIDSVQWRKDYYIVNRDSAFANPQMAIKKLMGGNRRFLESKTIRPRQDIKDLVGLNGAQKPFAVIVGCSDSRVPNEIILDQGIGDLFIIRSAGQVSDVANYGSMEYAVLKLQTKLIVVLGHTECGAVGAAVSRPKNIPGHIVTLINSIKPSVVKNTSNATSDQIINLSANQNVINEVNQLRDLDPILHNKYQHGEILIVGAMYDLKTGIVRFLPETLENLPTPHTFVDSLH